MCKFERFFEDNHNVYMLLELCSNNVRTCKKSLLYRIMQLYRVREIIDTLIMNRHQNAFIILFVQEYLSYSLNVILHPVYVGPPEEKEKAY